MIFGFTNSWHGDHEEVDTVPVRQLDSICEIWRVTAVFELKLKNVQKLNLFARKLLNVDTKYMMPAAVSQTEIKMDMSWASLQRGKLSKKNFALYHLIEVEVFSMLRYWRMSGTDIKRRARRKPNPVWDIFIKDLVLYKKKTFILS